MRLRLGALPLLADLRRPDSRPRRDDVAAGLLTAALLLPQALAYAQLAGLPARAGVLASLLPAIVYALFGRSRALAVGPVAVAALMVAEALARHAPEAALVSTAAVILAAEVGLLLLLLRGLRWGGLVALISHPVLLGFTAGAALLILLSQLAPLLGLALPRAGPLATLQAVVAALPRVDPLAAAPGLLAMLMLLARPLWAAALRRARLGADAIDTTLRTLPLVVVLLALLAVALLPEAARARLQLVGPLDWAAPAVDLPALADAGLWRALLPSAALIALVAFVESIAVARVLAARRREAVRPDAELGALGLANLAAAFSSAMPVAGSFSRSVVNAQAGARTQLAGVIAAFAVGALALLGSGVLALLPRGVLAAIIIVAFVALLDWRRAAEIYRYDRREALALAITLAGVLLLGIEAGLLVGVLLALGQALRRTMRPHITALGRVPGTEHFRNPRRHAVEQSPGLLLLRVDESLYFANIAAVEDRLEAELAAAGGPAVVRDLVLVLSAVSAIDASAEEALEAWAHSLEERGLRLHLAEVKGPVMDRLRQGRLARRLEGRIHLSTHAAVAALEQDRGAAAG